MPIYCYIFFNILSILTFQTFSSNLISDRFVQDLNRRGVHKTVCVAEPVMTCAKMGGAWSPRLAAATTGVMNSLRYSKVLVISVALDFVYIHYSNMWVCYMSSSRPSICYSEAHLPFRRFQPKKLFPRHFWISEYTPTYVWTHLMYTHLHMHPTTDGPLLPELQCVFVLVIFTPAPSGVARMYLCNSRKSTLASGGTDSACAITPKELISYAWQISRGMAYLCEMKVRIRLVRRWAYETTVK